MRIFIFLALLSLSFAFISPDIVSAENIVPCNGPDCQTCHFVQLGNNLVTWLVGAMAGIATIAVVIGGLNMATAGGDTGKISHGKELIQNALIGFVILLAAWLIIDTIMKTLVGDTVPGFGPWNEIACVAQPVTTVPTGTGGPGGIVTAPTPSPAAGCPTCTAMPNTIPTNGNPCAGGPTACVMRPEIATQLVGANLPTLGMRLSEGFPPAGLHQEPCHLNATCVDASFNSNSPTAAQINTATAAFTAQGLRPVYEVPNAARAAELQAQGVNALVVNGINREHYSLYNCALDSTPRACR